MTVEKAALSLLQSEANSPTPIQDPRLARRKSPASTAVMAEADEPDLSEEEPEPILGITWVVELPFHLGVPDGAIIVGFDPELRRGWDGRRPISGCSPVAVDWADTRGATGVLQPGESGSPRLDTMLA